MLVNGKEKGDHFIEGPKYIRREKWGNSFSISLNN